MLERNHGRQERHVGSRILCGAWRLTQDQRAMSRLDGDLELGQEGSGGATEGWGFRGSLSKTSGLFIDLGCYVLFGEESVI